MNVWLPYRRPAGGIGYRQVTLPRLDPVLRGYLVALGALALVATLGVWLWLSFVSTRPITVYVDGLHWSRGIEEQEWKTVEESDWGVPKGGRMLRQYQDIRYWQSVLSHYRTVTYTYSCGSNPPRTCTGTRSEPVYTQVPVYDTKYDYEIDKWVDLEWVRIQGDHLDRPHWPIPETYREPSPPELGDVRFNPDESTWEEAYAVRIIDSKGTAFPKAIDFKTWDQLELHDKLTGHITRRGVLRGVDWPEGGRT